MPVFSYIIKTYDGRVIQASIDAGDRHSALQLIHERSTGVVVQLDEDRAGQVVSHERPPPLVTRPPQRLRSGRIQQSHLAIFFRQLAISVNAGVPLRDSMEAIVEDLDHAALRKVLGRAVQRLHDGRTLSQALAEERAFPKMSIALIATAEESGSMGRILEDMANSMEKGEALTRKIRSITAYPLFVAVFFTIIVVVMTLFVLPQFQKVFGKWDAELPLMTRVVFGVNAAIVHHIWIVAIVLGAMVTFIVLYLRTEVGALNFDRLKLALPLFGVCFRKIAVARFSKNLAIMIRGGVPIATALDITAGVAGNRVIENALRNVRDKIVLGSDIASSMASERVFPGLLIRMISIGESSGRLPDVLEKISEGYESEVEGSIMVATSLFEPAVIIVFGFIILTLVMAIYLPVFSMASHAK